MDFLVGDKVTWTSQAASHIKTKTGTVFAIVPDGCLPRNCVDFKGHRPPDIGTCTPRPHESYIVWAEERPGRRRLYWPRVSLLKPGEPVLPPKVVVEISGGCCIAVHSAVPIQAVICDWDNLRDLQEEELHAISEATGEEHLRLLNAHESATVKAARMKEGTAQVL